MQMFDSYKYEWKGETRYVGPKELRSIRDENEWIAAMHAIVSTREPTLYETIKNNDGLIDWIGYGMYLEERYEYLLYLLDTEFRKAGTHPEWIVESINNQVKNKVREGVREALEYVLEEYVGWM